MKFEFNVTIGTDSYKIGHYPMYPYGTQNVYSYFESRTGAKFNNTIFFDLQGILKRYFLGQIVTKDKIEFGKYVIDKHLGDGVFNYDGWMHILNKHNGRLPLEIKAVPEGTPVPTSNVLMTVNNTDEKCFWLTNHMETMLTHVWRASSVATLSREIKILCKHYLEETADTLDGLNFMLHDFGYRAESCFESAGATGAAHLIPFLGTDTIAGIQYAMALYNADVCGFSVNATEHSIMTSEGPEREYELLKDLIEKYPTGILSIVIDSYDYERFIDTHARTLKDEILARDGKTVFRPDSGEPVSTTLRVLELLKSIFGSMINKKGYQILNPKIGTLWGDGIGYDGIRNILHGMRGTNWSADNIVFGMGGGLRDVNRDTQRFAFKCSAQKRNDEWRAIYKKPKDISKASKRGKQYLVLTDKGYKTLPNNASGYKDELQTVFINGSLIVDDNFEAIRERAAI